MKKMLFVLLLLAPCWAGAEKNQPNPADYTINVHVKSSHLMYRGSGDNGMVVEDLMVLIDGKTLELTNGATRNYALRLGDYKARIIQVKGQAARPYEDDRVYDFLFADGSTRNFYVAGEYE